MTKKASPSFEKNLQTLEKLVEQLEKGDLSLEESLKQFEKGITLARSCQESLKKAEQKIEILNKKSPNAATDLFDADTDEISADE